VAVATVAVLRGASIVLSIVSDSSGRFRFQAPQDGYTAIRVTRLGYRTTERAVTAVQAGDSLLIPIDPVPLQSAPVVVQATRSRTLEGAGFYARRRMGQGVFVTRDMIEQKYSTALSEADILRRVSGVTGVDETPHYVFVRLRGNRCPARIFVDGLPFGTQLHRLHAANIEGIEVYRGPSEVPAQYGGASAACGVVLVWLRTGMR
jgi:outer membrane cobalamin receptor